MKLGRVLSRFMTVMHETLTFSVHKNSKDGKNMFVPKFDLAPRIDNCLYPLHYYSI